MKKKKVELDKFKIALEHKFGEDAFDEIDHILNDPHGSAVTLKWLGMTEVIRINSAAPAADPVCGWNCRWNQLKLRLLQLLTQQFKPI